MKQDEAVEAVCELLKSNSFSFAYEVKPEPIGLRVIWEISQQEMDELVNNIKQHQHGRDHNYNEAVR